MAVGFGNTTETSNQYIKNFLKQRRTRLNIESQQEEWYREYSSRVHSYSLSDLLEPEHRDLKVLIDPDVALSSSRQHLKIRVLASCGYWSIWIIWDTVNEYWDITIGCYAGDSMRFQPDVIEECITGKYGRVVYKQWQAMIMDDLDSLQTLVNEVRNHIDFVVPSIVCCERSERLCRRVGIPVKDHFAFLFPSSYSL